MSQRRITSYFHQLSPEHDHGEHANPGAPVAQGRLGPASSAESSNDTTDDSLNSPFKKPDTHFGTPELDRSSPCLDLENSDDSIGAPFKKPSSYFGTPEPYISSPFMDPIDVEPPDVTQSSTCFETTNESIMTRDTSLDSSRYVTASESVGNTPINSEDESFSSPPKKPESPPTKATKATKATKRQWSEIRDEPGTSSCSPAKKKMRLTAPREHGEELRTGIARKLEPSRVDSKVEKDQDEEKEGGEAVVGSSPEYTDEEGSLTAASQNSADSGDTLGTLVSSSTSSGLTGLSGPSSSSLTFSQLSAGSGVSGTIAGTSDSSLTSSSSTIKQTQSGPDDSGATADDASKTSAKKTVKSALSTDISEASVASSETTKAKPVIPTAKPHVDISETSVASSETTKAKPVNPATKPRVGVSGISATSSEATKPKPWNPSTKPRTGKSGKNVASEASKTKPLTTAAKPRGGVSGKKVPSETTRPPWNPSTKVGDGMLGRINIFTETSKTKPAIPPKKPEDDASGKNIPAPETAKPKPWNPSTKPGAGMLSVMSAGSESDKNGVQFKPDKANYHPVNDAIWKQNDRIPFIALAKTLCCIEEESSRLKIVDILSNYFRSVIVLTPGDLLPSVYLCLNQLAPAYEDLELGFAETTLMKAIAECTGRSLAQMKNDYAELGDLGIVAEKSRAKQNIMFRGARLTVLGVYDKLVEIAKTGGKASLKIKMRKVINIFVACRGIEARYLVRLFTGKLRIGLAEQSVLQALAVACTKTPPGQAYPPEIIDFSTKSSDAYKNKLEKNSLEIKIAYCEYPNYQKLICTLLDKGIDALREFCCITAGIPMKPMLAQPTKGIKEIFLRFENCDFTCEWKYDGERAQIHMTENGNISIFSRNQENNTVKYPDIVNIMKKVVSSSTKSFILDCEAVAWNPENQQILPFQILSTRKRKLTAESEIKVQVCVFAFDLLLLNNEAQTKKPLRDRRALLRQSFTEVEGEFFFAKSMDTNNMEEVQSFLDEAIKGKCEGLMVKTLEQDATYEIAKRSHKWLKLKKDYLDGIGDTLDVVVIGGYQGLGKRTGLYGGFLLAVYDPNAEEFQSLCKIGTGFTDEDLVKHTEFFKQHIIPQPKSYYRYDRSHTPDVWFDAVQVWEIKGADLTYSPVYCAAKGLCGSDQRGISLRFPRFLRIRTDKPVTEATTAEQVATMYENQAQIDVNPSTSRNVEEDFY